MPAFAPFSRLQMRWLAPMLALSYTSSGHLLRGLMCSGSHDSGVDDGATE